MTMEMDATLQSVQSVGDSLLQAVLILGMLAFLLWNVKLSLEEIKE